MVHRGDILGDDRALIQIGGNIVGCCPHQFHAARMGLMIGPRAFKAGQCGMVNIDAPPFQFARQIIGQYLHIPGKNDNLCFGRIDKV